MEVSAKLKFARIGTQKARVVADMVRGKDVNDAVRILRFLSKKKAATMVKKLIESAVANADQKQTIDVDSLYVKSISVDQGPSYKRFMPRAQGRASKIQKKTSHVNVILDER